MELPLPCFVCRRVLDPAVPGSDSPMQPDDAVWFSAYGQYGSTVFDPCDGSQLRINVCDQCLAERSELVWHERYVDQPPLAVFSQPWLPDGER